MGSQAIKAYVKEFRQTKYRANQRRSLLHFFKFLVLVIGFFIAQYFLLQAELGGLAYVAIGLVLAFFHGLSYMSMWLVGHDCGHGSFSQNKKLNRWIGNLSTSFMLMNYENFRRSHNRHHKFIGNIEKDEAFGPKAKRKDFFIQRMVRCVMLLPFFAYLLGILLPGLTKSPGYFNYFWPDRTRASIQAFAFVLGHVLLLVTLLIYLPFAYVLFVGILPILFSWAFFLVTTFLNHTGEHTEWYPDEIWTYDQGVFNSVNLSYGPVIDFFLIGLGRDHFAHHINPRIPHYNLRAATDYIGTSHPHNQVVRGNFLKFMYFYYKYAYKRIVGGYFANSKQPFSYETLPEQDA